MDPIPEFAQRQWDFMDPIQRRYEVIRPLVLFTEETATNGLRTPTACSGEEQTGKNTSPP
jgi:hypothetical protein